MSSQRSSTAAAAGDQPPARTAPPAHPAAAATAPSRALCMQASASDVRPVARAARAPSPWCSEAHACAAARGAAWRSLLRSSGRRSVVARVSAVPHAGAVQALGCKPSSKHVPACRALSGPTCWIARLDGGGDAEKKKLCR